MAGWPSIRAGNATAVSRTALIEWVEEISRSRVYQWEVRRRTRLVEELERTRRQLAARRVQIPLSPAAARRAFGELPETIQLRVGELRIAFSDAPDLAAKLVELSQAMAHDWTGFMRAVERLIDHNSPLMSTGKGP